MRKGRFSRSWSPSPRWPPGFAAGGTALPRVASLQPVATAITAKPLPSRWQRGEALLDPFRRHTRQARELGTGLSLRLHDARDHRGRLTVFRLTSKYEPDPIRVI